MTEEYKQIRRRLESYLRRRECLDRLERRLAAGADPEETRERIERIRGYMREARSDVLDLIDRAYSDHYREIGELKYLEGLTPKEIADRTGFSEGFVKNVPPKLIQEIEEASAGS